MQELVVQADIHARAVFRWRRGIAIVQIDIDPVAAQEIEIRRQVQGDVNRRWLKPGRLELLFIGFQFAEGHRAIGADPVWRIVRFTRQQRFHVANSDAIATEQHVPLGNAFRRLDQIFIIATKYH
ncbi:hypothetical protein D3C72_1892160 [compost metagenome]